ncbi:dynein heavy chain 6, axonemal [Chelonus insularis]|uniref:dynein heavy chain 6, axonemal n=1 Tax=Chelonus insularis TaxID=460826 RepID=UPI0015884D51|nr:dynein heavy chain 6, axonemal [Chelonus insularis]
MSPLISRIVPYKEITRSYMTISANGVTQYSPEEMEFTPLHQWESEYKYYLKLMEIKTFRFYRMWKAFWVWRKKITLEKFLNAKSFIALNLFICDSIFSQGLLQIRNLCSEFFHYSFMDVNIVEKLSLFDFVEIQARKLEYGRSKLIKLRENVMKITYEACIQSLLQAKYTIDDSNITIEQTTYGKLGRFASKVHLRKDDILKMSFIEQTNKRKKCKRLSCFIHLVDYILMICKLNVLENTYIDFLNVLRGHFNFLSNEEQFSESRLNIVMKDFRPLESPFKNPYWIVDLTLSNNKLEIDPPDNVFWFVIRTIRAMWRDELGDIKPLLTDSYFNCFTKPMINRVVDKDRLAGSPPDFVQVVNNDPTIQSFMQEMDELIELNVISLRNYYERFKKIETFYKEDKSFDDNIIQKNLRCDIFRQWCLRYKNEEEVIFQVTDLQPLGIFFLQMKRFKEEALKAPAAKWRILQKIMPEIGKSKVEKLLNDAIDTETFLNSAPSTTDDFVAYISFIDEAQWKLDLMDNELEYVKELYEIMEEYNIPVSAIDVAQNLAASDELTNLKQTLKKCLEEREQLILKLNQELEKDVKNIIEDVAAIDNEVKEPWLINTQTDITTCTKALESLSKRIQANKDLVTRCQNYQKKFKLEVVRLDVLDHVEDEIRLRTLLWESIISWKETIKTWYSCDFNSLDIEEITNMIMRYSKIVNQLEKGLPSNDVLPQFKSEVKQMQEKLPIISYLKNPSLKSRHWSRIESLLNCLFDSEHPITLDIIEEYGVFEHQQELMEISATATSEATLENMLDKIQDTWKTLEFIILPHKEYKNVFILGSLEEIQSALEESNIAIQTISASRYVSPIKSRVDEWIKQMELFSTTLDAWQYCQQQWMYLEAIFSAADIQRQLPVESKLFIKVDRSWREIMRKAFKMPVAMELCTQTGLLRQFEENNRNLDEITKCLEAYLETKRIAFPRFFFLSNDELLEILAQTRNPHAVQKYLQKCFDAIYRLEFASASSTADITSPIILTTEILAMISPEGEKVNLGKNLKARGGVEYWLKKVEESMFISLKRIMKLVINDYEEKEKQDIIISYPSQIVLTVSQIFWARDVHCIFEKIENTDEALKSFELKCYSELNQLAGMVRGELHTLVRDVIINLITIDVHARDIITSLIENKVSSSTDFEWTKNLRYYWDQEIDNCVVRMSTAEYLYGYEYLGAQKRLVITPLTDKCYLCLMGALQLKLGGAPAGPAGTGKTETTKDLAKALAIQCIVFNCSEGLDFKIMGRFFSGIATSGAWCCFDEFNRIDIEVLSVIAQQLITIKNAKVAGVNEFMFESRMINLVMSCATFITMNPGYAGRTELPDNLKSLFRPISMMVPDYKLIAEVILYSEGFESSKQLSIKMTLMYTLCSEQLSQQDHYDFGMRAVKSVLMMAGSLKRENPDKSEEVVLIKALRDSNLPKFLADDANLFLAILSDLFPNTYIPDDNYGVFEETIISVMTDAKLQPEKSSIVKTIQLHETIRVRHGVMLVGPTGGGKTTVLHTLCDTYYRLFEQSIPGPFNKKVNMYVLNPKAVTIGELYGEIDTYSNEWQDGLLGAIIRKACASEYDDNQWVICDGPVDALWIENMNTVLDDNKMLCLANSERIKFTPYVRMIFEVMDLAQASPATVSRCGMVYVDPLELGWMPYVKSWLSKLQNKLPDVVIYNTILELFEKYIEDGLVFLKKNCQHVIAQVDMGKVNMVCTLLESILLESEVINKTTDNLRLTTIVTQSFVFSYLWGIGGNVTDGSRKTFELFVRTQLEKDVNSRELWNFYINPKLQQFDLWQNILPTFQYDENVPFFEILVPTIDTVRFGYLIKKMIMANKPVFITGTTGVGKSVIVKLVLNTLRETGLWITVSLNFSAQTSSKRTQDIIELKLEKKKKSLLGAPMGKKVCVFVDDVNMPRLDTYGSQPPLELLRQVLDFSGFYDRKKLFWKIIEDMVLVAACAPPGGGRNPLSPRFVRHFGMLVVPTPTEASLNTIFTAIIRGFLDCKHFQKSIQEIGDKIVNATVELYNRIAIDLLPTPTKSHYIFNLRDLSKCIQGIMQSDPMSIRDTKQMTRLFYHECLRVFHDRLVDNIDKAYFYQLLSDTCSQFFGDQVISPPSEDNIELSSLFFGDFMKFGAPKESRVYEEITDIEKMKSILQDYLDDYCLNSKKDMKLIFFSHAIEHLCRLARILRSERGHGLLVGVGGMGKQSLTKLASHLNGYPCWQIEVIRGYDKNSWHSDLRNFYFKPGVAAEDATFLFTDTQIVMEEFLEDINNTLNSGEILNLYEAEELEKVIIATRPAAKAVGIPETNRDEIYDYFIGRVRNHLHLILCMSPAGNGFRRRCRMFPSLVNCCTIDWFTKWPSEALISVAEISIIPSITTEPDLANALTSICVLMHQSVDEMTERYYIEMGRRYYTTPSSYLELLRLFSIILNRKTKEIASLKTKIGNGLNKLYETRETVAIMKKELIVLTPQLQTSSEEVTNLMKVLAKERIECDQARAIVSADEAVAKVKAQETALLEAEARKDLEAAMPALEEAQKALQSLNKNDINEIRVFNKPPPLVRYVMEAVCLLLGEKTDWATAKLVLSDLHFLDRLINYPKDKINDKLLKKLQSYINNPEFIPKNVAKQSKVCKSICIWVRAIDGYAKVFRVVEPKRIVFEKAQNELQSIENILYSKQNQLAEVENKILELQNQYDSAVRNLKQLQSNIALNEARLNRSGRLIMALEDEQELWEEMTQEFESKTPNLIGDSLVAAGALVYFGAFSQSYRQELLKLWLTESRILNIKIATNFNLIDVLVNPFQIQAWNIFGLPRDQTSAENALLVTQAKKWPLIIDPQEQAYHWIRNMEAKNDLKICAMNDPNLTKIVERSIRLGTPVMINNAGEVLDPSLDPVLLQQTFNQKGQTFIRFGNTDIEYEDSFKLYITSKIANPHYLPEVCIKVTVVNFTVTPSGLEEQLLADVVRLERPDLEKQRNELLAKINSDNIQLQNIEDKILSMLFNSTGNILDNEDLIESLNDSKETSAMVATRLAESQKTEEKIIIAREKYRTVATRGSILFFVIASLAEIDSMYQFSLKYFKLIFNNAIELSEKSKNIGKRLNTLFERITLSIYLNVSRGLFEKHKLILSFMISVAIRMNEKTITQQQWNFLLRGPGQIKNRKKPDCATLNDSMWKSINYLDGNFKSFNGIVDDALKKIELNIGYLKEEINIISENNDRALKNWDTLLNDIEKLMLLKALKEERLIFGISAFIKNNLGQKYIESSVISLADVFSDTSNKIPLIFILSPGSDPFGAFHKLAGEKGFTDKYHSISLGQGQGPIAESLIKESYKKGQWIFLQNCHLASSWMPRLERLVIEITEAVIDVHKDFRLFLSSLPSSTFPISVLENAVKITNEPPKGLKANMKRMLFDLDEDFFEQNDLGLQWRSMIYGICFFHAIIQERKKFGPLGWNISYEFTDNDRECCFKNLEMSCNNKNIPWSALTYTTGEITYGGRITDNWDLRCLKTILNIFFSPKIFEEDYRYSPSGLYYRPNFTRLQDYKNFVEIFPLTEEPEIFGMDENANIIYQLQESRTITNTILEIQPKVDIGSEEKSSSEIVYETTQIIMNRTGTKIDPDECNQVHYKRDSEGRLPSFTTVLLHEVERYNKLLYKIHASMETLQQAIKGFVVMSDELENIFNSLLNNQVPKQWHNLNVYPSLKSLGSWIRDLELRTSFIKTWLINVEPTSFWISGFSFPQGFITSILQTHARKYNIPIDLLKLDYVVMKVVLNQEVIQTENNKKNSILYPGLMTPSNGVFVHGLYLDAGKWDFESMTLIDAAIGEINPQLPVINIIPVLNLPTDDNRYICPLYKTAIRAGVLSTTGHSTNFVTPILLPSSREQAYWILKGTALLIQITD